MNFQAPEGRKSRVAERQGRELEKLIYTTPPMHSRFLCCYNNAYSDGIMSPMNDEKLVIKKKYCIYFTDFFGELTGIYTIWDTVDTGG